MPKIIKMDDHLANLIAAGEVVERPASIIKELCENSIDAGATRIKIEVFEQGLGKIIITDNGIGMDKEDLHLAVLSHATSKIHSEQDLNNILTNGFRGEALASIASVAKIKLSSRMKDSDAYFVLYEQNQCLDEGLTTLPLGTKIEVMEVFANVPARFKYLKNEQYEKNQIISVFEKLALSNPKIAFSLYFDDKLYKETLGSQESLLIETILGKNIYQDCMLFEEEITKVKAKIYLVSPFISRANRKSIHLFINNRPINNYALTQAIINAYVGLLMTNRYPIVLAYLEIDPQLIDVNVHPQKLEVKLANEMMLAYSLESKLKDFLQSNFKKPLAAPVAKINAIKEQLILDATQGALTPPTKAVTQPIEVSPIVPEIKVTINDNPLGLEYIGQFSGTYLLFQGQNGLYLIDQHAAAEKVKYEHLIKSYLEADFSQINLLFPLSLNLMSEDLRIIENNLDLFNQLGFKFEKALLSAYPSIINEKDLELAIESVINLIKAQRPVTLYDYIQDLVINVSCKRSVKANTFLSSLEVKKLVSDLFLLPNYMTCPHGRPIIVNLSLKEIEKMFKRIV